jgi:dihydroflavonol-4-reductase
MLVAVTGGTGHVGANLLRVLLAAGHRVRTLVHKSTRAIEGLDVEQVPGDVLDPGSLRELCDGVEVVFHLAAVISLVGDRSGRVERVNVEGTRNVTEAALAARVRRLVHASSIHAFDLRPRGEPLDETRPRSEGREHAAYDRSKAAGERAVRHACDRGLDAVIVNPTGVLGPYDYGPSRMGRFFLALLRRGLWALVEGGFDWVDARDVSSGMMAAASAGRRGEGYILSGHWCSVVDLSRLAQEITHVPPPRWTVPLGVAKVGAPFSSLGARLLGRDPLYTTESLRALRAEPSIVRAKAERELDYRVRPLRETVESVYQWLSSDGLITRP